MFEKILSVGLFLMMFHSAGAQTPSVTPKSATVQPLSEEARVKICVKQFADFVADLHKGDFEKVKPYLCETYIENFTREKLEKLSVQIKRNKEFVVWARNMYYQPDGAGPALIEFNYKDTSPPQIIIVTFDEKNRISSVEPQY
jgi:hypothetical protein